MGVWSWGLTTVPTTLYVCVCGSTAHGYICVPVVKTHRCGHVLMYIDTNMHSCKSSLTIVHTHTLLGQACSFPLGEIVAVLIITRYTGCILAHFCTGGVFIFPLAKQSKNWDEGAASALCWGWADPYLLDDSLQTPQGTWLKTAVAASQAEQLDVGPSWHKNAMLFLPLSQNWRIKCSCTFFYLRSQSQVSYLSTVKCLWKCILC